MLRRIAWGFALGVAAVVVSVPLWVQVHRADLPAPGDEALLAPAPAAGEADGFPHFRAAVQQLDATDGNEEQLRAMGKRVAWDPKLSDELLRRNAPALKELERGVAAGFVRIPPERTALDAEARMPAVFGVQDLVRLVSLDAQRLAKRGDREAAFERALFGLKVGHVLARSEGADLLVLMGAVACQGIALDELEHLLHELPLTPGEAKQLAARIELQRIPAEAWQAMWAVEYRGWKARFAGLESTDEDRKHLPISLRWVPADYLYQPNRTLSLFAGYARERQEGSGLSCREAFGPASAPTVRRLEMLRAPNSVGNRFAAISIPNYNRFELRRCHNEARLGLVQVAAALGAWTHAQGALPETLDALVPAYLDSLPLDRYDGAPLRYAKQKAIVYSVGDDFADAGGFDPPSQSERSEPTISVAF